MYLARYELESVSKHDGIMELPFWCVTYFLSQVSLLFTLLSLVLL